MTTFRILTAAAALAMIALLLHAGQPEELSWWPAALPLALWAVGPTLAPYLLAARQSQRWFSATMLLYFAASSILSGAAYGDAFFRSQSSTAALVMVFVPTYQWVALALLLFFCRAAVRLTGRGKAA